MSAETSIADILEYSPEATAGPAVLSRVTWLEVHLRSTKPNRPKAQAQMLNIVQIRLVDRRVKRRRVKRVFCGFRSRNASTLQGQVGEAEMDYSLVA